MESSTDWPNTYSSIVSRFAPSLPVPSGTYRVAFQDFEYQSSNPIESAIQNHGNIFLRLFYPTSAQLPTSPLKRSLWCCHPKYLRGYLDFIGIPEVLGFPAIYLTLGRARLPCIEGADLATPDAYPNLIPSAFPILYFSHGLGGMRTTYSHICYELASYGFVVASFEHLDGTACVAFSDGGRRKVPYKKTLAIGAGQEGREFQLKHRVGEIERCMEFIAALQEGNDEIKLYDLDRAKFNPLKQHKDSSSLKILARQFKGRLDLSASYLGGHSFGATTAIEAAYQFAPHHNTPFNSSYPLKAVLAFDPWMALAGEHLFLEPLSRPTLVINTHLFQDQPSIQKLHRLFRIETSDSSDLAEKESKMLTILNAGHQAQSDIAMLLPSRFVKLLGLIEMVGTLDPELTLRLTTKACREYLGPYLPHAWKAQISPDPSIFNPDPEKRPKDVIIGTSLYQA